jgi:universal bacterial protein YeaZ
MNIIAVECSGSVASTALWVDGKICAESLLDGPLTHSQIIMPMLERCFELAEMTMEDFGAIACNVGPGSFTGLRIGVSSANAIAHAAGLRRIAVNSLESLLYNAAWLAEGLVVPVLDARGQRIYSAAYICEKGKWEEQIPPTASTIDDWIETLPETERYLFLGDGAQLHFESIAAKMQGKEVRLAPAHQVRHRAASLAAAAAHRAEQGMFIDSFEAFYLRESQAEQERKGMVG